ncbi:MAG: RNA 3'-phosphate cyclase [Burkholderiales bacterium]|nr:MAG: RNA 3'-phosphate cyclase [Burkholderiales bacterium]
MTAGAAPIEIDGSTGEGGGQLVRTAVALAAVSGKPVRIARIRAGRERPGLAAQHLTAVRAVAAFCDATVHGLELRSREIAFDPGPIGAGAHVFEVGTAGSVTLVLQALLPVMAMAPTRSRVTVRGGTDVRAAPALDYTAQVILPLLERLGMRVSLECLRRGYYPRGGGEIACEVEPARPRVVDLSAPGALRAVNVHSHVGNLPSHIAERMAGAARAQLRELARCAVDCEAIAAPAAVGTGGAVVAAAHLDGSSLGAGRIAERGIRAEQLGTEAGAELTSDLSCGAALDVHAADQLLVHLALAGPGSQFTTREITSHARTAMWLIEQFLPVRFRLERQAQRILVRVEARAHGGTGGAAHRGP